MGSGAAVAELGLRSGAELGEELVQLRHQIDLLELSFSLRAADFARTSHYDDEGSASPIDWIRINCHMTSQAAAGRVAVGRRMCELPVSYCFLSRGFGL